MEGQEDSQQKSWMPRRINKNDCSLNSVDHTSDTMHVYLPCLRMTALATLGKII